MWRHYLLPPSSSSGWSFAAKKNISYTRFSNMWSWWSCHSIKITAFSVVRILRYRRAYCVWQLMLTDVVTRTAAAQRGLDGVTTVFPDTDNNVVLLWGICTIRVRVVRSLCHHPVAPFIYSRRKGRIINDQWDCIVHVYGVLKWIVSSYHSPSLCWCLVTGGGFHVRIL